MVGRKKSIIIGAVVLAVLVLAVVAVAVILPAIGSEEPTPQSPDYLEIYDFDPAFITRLEFTNVTLGDDYYISKGLKAGSVFYSITGDDVFEYDQTDIMLTFDMIAGLTGNALVEQKPTDLDKYGIKAESPKVTVEKNDGTKPELVFGDAYPLDSNYRYLYVSDKDAVYTVSLSIYNTLTGPYTYYRDVYIFPLITEGTYDELQGFSCIQPDGQTLSFSRSEDSFSVFTLTEPLTGLVDNYNVSDKIMDKILELNCLGVVEDHPQDLAAYGLDKPVKLIFDLKDGSRTVILLGAVTENFVFVMREGTPMVVAVTGDFSFTEVIGQDILDIGLFMYPIKDVTKGVFTTPEGKTYVLEVDDRTDEEGNGEFFATFQGKNIKQGDARSLYAGMLSFYSIGSYTKGVSGEPDYTLTFTMRAGGENRLELYRINSRQYATSVNGVCTSYVSVTAVNHLLELIDMLERGESIEEIF